MIRFKRKLVFVANLNFLTNFDRYFNGFHKVSFCDMEDLII